MSSGIWKGQAFCVSHADGTGTFKSHFTGGLRAFFEYRDLVLMMQQKENSQQM